MLTAKAGQTPFVWAREVRSAPSYTDRGTMPNRIIKPALAGRSIVSWVEQRAKSGIAPYRVIAAIYATPAYAMIRTREGRLLFTRPSIRGLKQHITMALDRGITQRTSPARHLNVGSGGTSMCANLFWEGCQISQRSRNQGFGVPTFVFNYKILSSGRTCSAKHSGDV